MKEWKIKSIFRERRSLVLSTLLMAVIIAPLTIVIVSRAYNGPVPAEPVPQPSAHVQSLRVFVHGEDIYPLVARVRPGRLMLNAENETQSDVALVIEKIVPGQAGRIIASVSTQNRAKRSAQEVDIGAGEYVFYEQSQPEVRGRLIVEAR
jgi:hypothetical protein